MRAVCTIRAEPHYRRHAFEAGLERAGYRIGEFVQPGGRDDLLVIWNRQAADENRANEWEAAGGTVLVCENGYCGRDAEGRQLYAISVHGHNGSGWFPVGDGDRFAPLGVELKPWNSNPRGHILVCAQRGIGSRLMASPARWESQMAKRLAAMRLPFKVRQHPGRKPSETTLEQDLAGARACLIWSSASGLRALQMGVPVAFAAPHWIASGAASRGLVGVERLVMDDEARLAAFQRLAWAQWTVDEIESAEPFVRIRENLEHAKWP